MTPETTVMIGAVVAMAAELIKRYYKLTEWRPFILSVVLSLAFVVAWGISFESGFSRSLVWPYLMSWVSVATTASFAYEGMKNATTAIRKNSE